MGERSHSQGPASGECGDCGRPPAQKCAGSLSSLPHSVVDVRGLDRGFQKPKEGWETLGKPGSRRVAESQRGTGRLTEGHGPCPPHSPSQKSLSTLSGPSFTLPGGTQLEPARAWPGHRVRSGVRVTGWHPCPLRVRLPPPPGGALAERNRVVRPPPATPLPPVRKALGGQGRGAHHFPPRGSAEGAPGWVAMMW